MVWLLLMVCALCFMSFQLAYDAYRGKQQKKMSDFLRKQMIIQQQTYKQQYENIRKVRKTQHDMKHRLVVIEQQLLEKDYERAQNYTRLQKKMELISALIWMFWKQREFRILIWQ